MKGPVALIILDGWGLAEPGEGNAVWKARTPVMDRLQRTCPNSRLRADGEFVGLHRGQMGNSNVGHLTLGAGRVIFQDMVRIDRAVESGDLARNEALLELFAAAREQGGRIHLAGLVSEGGVHSHLRHLLALIRIAREAGLEPWVHAFTDGRDVPPTSAAGDLERLQAELAGGPGGIATVTGRYYGMDRDRRWDRTEAAYRALTEGAGEPVQDPVAAVRAAYARGETDEFLKPMIVQRSGRPAACIEAGDAVLFFNFRADRARQMCYALYRPEFDGFIRRPLGLRLACMTEYDRELGAPVLFPPQRIENTLGRVLSARGLRQLRIAETEKYAHVTYFFNGGVEEPDPGEERILVPSPKVATYDLQPEMSAAGIEARLREFLADHSVDLIVLNFANPDMVGHTGDLAAAVRAVEETDRRLGGVLQALEERTGTALVIADHGNAEVMVDPASGGPHTAHTTNPVPCVLVGAAPGVGLRDGALADVAPTLLDLLDLPAPPEMEGKSLLKHGD